MPLAEPGWTEISALRDRSSHELEPESIRLQLRNPRGLAWAGAVAAWAAGSAAAFVVLGPFALSYLALVAVAAVLYLSLVSARRGEVEVRLTRQRLQIHSDTERIDVLLHRIGAISVHGDVVVVALRTGRVRRIGVPARSLATQEALLGLAREVRRGASAAVGGGRVPGELMGLIARSGPRP